MAIPRTVRPEHAPAPPAIAAVPEALRPVDSLHDEVDAFGWGGLYRAGGLAAFGVVVLMVIQGLVFAISPPPDSNATDWFERFEDNRLSGLLAMDGLMLVDYVLIGLLFVALAAALWRVSASATVIGTASALLGVAIYFASNPVFDMLTLSHRYAAATTDAERAAFLGAGEAALARYTGTAFDVSYVLMAIATLIVSLVMLRSGVFSRLTAYAGIAMGVTATVPPTAGQAGLVLSFLSLLPTALWLVLTGRRLLQLGRRTPRRTPSMRRGVPGRRDRAMNEAIAGGA